MLEDLSAYLESQGLGVVGQDIFRHRFPDAPDRAMVLTPYAGSPGPRVHDALLPAFRVERVQIMCRGSTRNAAMGLANGAYAILWLDNALLGGTQVVKSEPLQPPFDMPEDTRNRAVVVFNVEVWSV